MSVSVDDLREFDSRREFFIGIDSDGCVFDTMEVKHKECFCPAFINHFELQAAAKYGREIWEFVNLYSKSRGINRFKAVLEALDLAAARPEVTRRGVSVPRLQGLRDWVSRESKLGNPTLKAELERTGDADLKHVYAWSLDVNEAVEKIVRGVAPFPNVTESLTAMGEKADVVVVSQTPGEALDREWKEHELSGYARLICGQEVGTKSEHLQLTTADRYQKDHILMLGDAPGDLKAARAVDALFYPIIPGREEESWARLLEEGLDRFFSLKYAGSYEKELLEDFERALPATPPWERAH